MWKDIESVVSCKTKRFGERIYYAYRTFLSFQEHSSIAKYYWKRLNYEEFYGFIVAGSDLPLSRVFKVLLSGRQEFRGMCKGPDILLFRVEETNECIRNTWKLRVQVHRRMYEKQRIQTRYRKQVAAWCQASRSRLEPSGAALWGPTRHSRNTGWVVIRLS